MTLRDGLVVAIILVPFIFLLIRLERTYPKPKRIDVVELAVDLGWHGEGVYTLAPPIDCPGCGERLLKVDVVHYPNEDMTISCPECDGALPVERVTRTHGLIFLEVVS